jgi:hypothetical protein
VGAMRLRDYGLGDSDAYVRGVPRVLGPVARYTCPHCHCATVFKIEVSVEHPRLRGGGHGLGTYIGCPACPWASVMVMRAGAPKEPEDHARD